MKFHYSKTLNKRFNEVMSKLSSKERGELFETTPNPLYDNVVVPNDDRFVWFEEGAEWAQQYPTDISVHRVHYDTCMYYMIGTEIDCFSHLANFSSSKSINEK